MTRLLLEVSSLARWSGPPTGMMRVESEIAQFLAALRACDTMLCVFHAVTGHYHGLNEEFAEALLGWNSIIEPWPAPANSPTHFTPNARLKALRWMERQRITSHGRVTRSMLSAIQSAVLSVKSNSYPFKNKNGGRIDLVPFDMAAGPHLELGAGDVVISPSSDWSFKDAPVIAKMKARAGFRLIVFCYDIIPIKYPEFFPDADAKMFRKYWDEMFAIADVVVVNAHAVARDVREHCERQGLRCGKIAVVPLGCDPANFEVDSRLLPPGLQPGRFVLYVSTIEPRKNHRLLLRVWRKLLSSGVVARDGFKLVFVGRPGWMVDDVLAELAEPEAFAGTVLHLAKASDSVLAALYQNTAFCVLPSIYEGFGLPIVEAYAYGKAVLASNGGSLAEVSAGLSPSLDPYDEDAWCRVLTDWISDPRARAPYETRISSEFQPRSWCRVAEEVLEIAKGPS